MGTIAENEGLGDYLPVLTYFKIHLFAIKKFYVWFSVKKFNLSIQKCTILSLKVY